MTGGATGRRLTAAASTCAGAAATTASGAASTTALRAGIGDRQAETHHGRKDEKTESRVVHGRTHYSGGLGWQLRF